MGRALGDIIADPFWDYVDMGLANLFIVYEKIVSTFSSGSKDNIAKKQKDFKKMVAVELIAYFCSRKHNPSNTKQYRGQCRQQIDLCQKPRAVQKMLCGREKR